MLLLLAGEGVGSGRGAERQGGPGRRGGDVRLADRGGRGGVGEVAKVESEIGVPEVGRWRVVLNGEGGVGMSGG